MLSNLSFENNEWFTVVVLTALLLWGIFVWKTWNGRADKRFYLNGFVGFVAVLCLSLLFLRPTLLQKAKGEAILLTKGYQKETLDSLKRTNRRISVLDYGPGMDLSPTLDSMDHIFILGHGVREYDLWQFTRGHISFIPSEVSEGIVRLNYNQRAKVGDDLMVEGIYKNQDPQTKLILKGPGGDALDSVIVSGTGNQRFQLKTNLKARGKFLYHVRSNDLADTTKTNPLPVYVDGNTPLNILIINEFPSFETKYLKNFLSQEGHRVIVKTKLTKQKYKFEYFNLDRLPIYSLNRDNLASIDLIVFDDRSLNNLSNTEQAVLSESINTEGLGLFVQQTGNRFQPKNGVGDFDVLPVEENTLKIEAGTKPLLEKYQVDFTSTGLTAMRIGNYGYSKQFGHGRIGTTILKNTYQLVLDGKHTEYKEIWTSMINGVRKLSRKMSMFRSDFNWAFVNEPYEFSLFTSEENPNVGFGNQYQVPLIKNPVVFEEWQGTVYPKNKGWHQLVPQWDSILTQNFYVMDEGRWNALINQNTLKLNKRFFNSAVSSYQNKFLPQRIPSIWFFVVFLSAMAYLWLVPKLR